jgi:hypothetical protein
MSHDTVYIVISQVAEEQRIESGVARETMSNAGVTVVARVRGDQDAESSAVGGVLQLHLPAIQRLLLHTTTGVRANALNILGVLTRQVRSYCLPYLSSIFVQATCQHTNVLQVYALFKHHCM